MKKAEWKERKETNRRGGKWNKENKMVRVIFYISYNSKGNAMQLLGFQKCVLPTLLENITCPLSYLF